MPQSLTKEHLDAAVDELGKHFNKSQESFRQEVADQFAAVGKRFDHVDKRFDRVDRQIAAMSEDLAKVKSAVVDLLATDRHLHNLVRELKAQGIRLDDQKIFASKS